MTKKIKKLVHSSSPKAEFTWITLTENQNKFLDVFNNFMDEEGNKVFNDLGGMRKKLKIDSSMPTKEEVIAWIS